MILCSSERSYSNQWNPGTLAKRPWEIEEKCASLFKQSRNTIWRSQIIRRSGQRDIEKLREHICPSERHAHCSRPDASEAALASITRRSTLAQLWRKSPSNSYARPNVRCDMCSLFVEDLKRKPLPRICWSYSKNNSDTQEEEDFKWTRSNDVQCLFYIALPEDRNLENGSSK